MWTKIDEVVETENDGKCWHKLQLTFLPKLEMKESYFDIKLTRI